MADSTREKLLEAARAEFFERGWSATGLAIRVRAGVSQGSWAHFFPGGKEQAAHEIYAELHFELWGGTLNLLEVGLGIACPPLLKAMTSFLDCVGRQPDKWRLLFQLEHGLSQDGPMTRPTRQQQQLHCRVEQWSYAYLQSQKRDPFGPLVYPIIFGPVITAVTRWLADPEGADPVEWATFFTDTAMATIGGTPHDRIKVPKTKRPSGGKDRGQKQSVDQISLLGSGLVTGS